MGNNNNTAEMMALAQDNAKAFAKCGENLIKGCQETAQEAMKGCQQVASQIMEAGQEAAKSVASATQEMPSVKSMGDFVRIQSRIGQAMMSFSQTAFERTISENSKLAESCLRTFQQCCAPLTQRTA